VLFRLFVLLSLLLSTSYACKGGYDACIQKVKDSHTIRKNSLYIPVKDHKLLVYSQQKPKAKILKYDPFLSLYLIDDKDRFPYPFDTNMRVQLGTAVVNRYTAKEGKIVKAQVGINSLGRYSSKVKSPAIITSSCCSLEGIVTPNGVIDKSYINRFLKVKDTSYSDIGVRVKQSKNCVKVIASNPYIKANKLKKGDCIVSIDGVRVRSASYFMRKILFSKIGSTHTIKVKRASKLYRYKVKTFKRYGGGKISDTFLEQKGIYFDDTLHIVKLSKYFKNYGLEIGDKLIQVNGVKVKTQKELRNYIETSKKFSSLLFDRKHFQFFVNIK